MPSSPTKDLHAEHGPHPAAPVAGAVRPQAKTALQRVRYHLYTIWLFTESDLATTYLQILLFGVGGAASGQLTTTKARPDAGHLARTLPGAAAFAWILLLVFQLANQTMAGAPAEDALNKPWRPIPAGRISHARAQALRLPATALALLVAWVSGAGATAEAAAFVVLTYLYNDLGGSEGLLWRNLSTGAMLGVLCAGTLRVAAAPAPITATGYAWCGVVAAAIAMTIQTQDFRDQDGDSARGRRTLPLVVGDAPARWFTDALLLVWALLCPLLCGAGLVGYGLSLATGSHAAYALFAHRTRVDDRRSYRLWSRWLAVVFAMPLLSLFP